MRFLHVSVFGLHGPILFISRGRRMRQRAPTRQRPYHAMPSCGTAKKAAGPHLDRDAIPRVFPLPLLPLHEAAVQASIWPRDESFSHDPSVGFRQEKSDGSTTTRARTNIADGHRRDQPRREGKDVPLAPQEVSCTSVQNYMVALVGNLQKPAKPSPCSPTRGVKYAKCAFSTKDVPRLAVAGVVQCQKPAVGTDTTEDRELCCRSR